MGILQTHSANRAFICLSLFYFWEVKKVTVGKIDNYWVCMLEWFSYHLEMKTREQNRNNKIEPNIAICLVYRTDTKARNIWLVKWTLGWKNVVPENFLEINRYFALTSCCNTIGQSNNAFSILGFSLAGKRRGHVLIFSSTGW